MESIGPKDGFWAYFTLNNSFFCVSNGYLASLGHKADDFDLVVCTNGAVSVLGMKAEQRPWTIHLQAKAKHFHFKLKATKYLPTCYNFFQFSLFLKISHLLISVRSDNNQTGTRNSLKSKITGVIDKFRSRPSKRKSLAAHKPSQNKRSKSVSYERPICDSTVVIGNLALLIQPILEKDAKGIIIHCLSILLYIIMRLKSLIWTKSNKFLLVSIVAMVGYPLWSHMKNNPSYDERTFASRYFRKAWNWAAQVF